VVEHQGHRGEAALHFAGVSIGRSESQDDRGDRLFQATESEDCWRNENMNTSPTGRTLSSQHMVLREESFDLLGLCGVRRVPRLQVKVDDVLWIKVQARCSTPRSIESRVLRINHRDSRLVT